MVNLGIINTNKENISGEVISENHSKTAVNYSISRDYAVSPLIPFSQCQEYYLTVGKVQNTIESFVSQIINRDWYFESDDDNVVQMLKEWESDVKLSRLIEDIVRNWLIHGHVIIGKSDLSHVQYSTIVGMVRDEYGHPLKFVQQLGYDKTELKADDFISEPFIQLDRSGWGVGLYHSLMSSYSEDGKTSEPLLSIYRRMEQDISKIHHKYASPRTIISFPEASQTQMDNDILPLLKSQKQGDRLAINFKPELISESIDGKARFTDSINQINSEIEAGLQSSSSRLITQPSAMADAREAGSQDDERVLALMEKIRRLFDEQIIPLVIGGIGKAQFKWGAKDDFDLTFPSGLEKAMQLGIVSKDEAREILKSRGWKIEDTPIPDEPDNNDVIDLMQKSNDLLSQKNGTSDLEREALELRKEAYEKILQNLNKKPKRNESKGNSKKSTSA
jgi:hypothetical protein